MHKCKSYTDYSKGASAVARLGVDRREPFSFLRFRKGGESQHPGCDSDRPQNRVGVFEYYSRIQVK